MCVMENTYTERNKVGCIKDPFIVSDIMNPTTTTNSITDSSFIYI